MSFLTLLYIWFIQNSTSQNINMFFMRTSGFKLTIDEKFTGVKFNTTQQKFKGHFSLQKLKSIYCLWFFWIIHLKILNFTKIRFLPLLNDENFSLSAIAYIFLRVYFSNKRITPVFLSKINYSEKCVPIPLSEQFLRFLTDNL